MSHIVRISNARTNGSGTACVVGPDLVLTALHVVQPQYRTSQAPTSPVLVLADGHEAELAWPPADEVRNHPVDVALLRWTKHKRASWAELDSAWPVGANFESKGFAGSLTSGSVPITGQLADHDGHPNLGRLDCSRGQTPPQSDHWEGVSGAPVLVGGRVCGVIAWRQYKWIKQADGTIKKYEWPKLLDATLVSAVLALPGFTLLLPQPDPLRDALVALIQKCPAIAQALDCGNEADTATSATDRLLDRRAFDALLAINVAHERAVRTYYESSQQRNARDLCDGLYLTAGLVIARHAPVPTRDGFGVHVVKTRTSSGVELSHSRLEGIAPRFEPLKDAMDRPRGRYALPLSPDVPTKQSLIVWLCGHLAEKLHMPGGTPTDFEVVLAAYRSLGFAEKRARYYFEVASKDRVDRRLDEQLQQLASAIPSLRVLENQPAEGSYELGLMPVYNEIRLRQESLPSA